MMPPILFHLAIFRNGKERKRSEKALYALLYALCACNLEYLRQFPGTVELYKSGVRYANDVVGEENWKDISNCIIDGLADCKSLASWRVAELNAQGIKARPYIRWRGVPGFSLYHILVRHPGGKIEDPSMRLGM